jgi:FMN reductase
VTTAALSLAVVIGAATPPGRLSRAAAALADAARGERPDLRVSIVDLAATPVEICDGRPEDGYGDATRAAIRTVRDASAVAIASPVYRASYPGVLKNFIDLLPVEALAGKPVGILAMGASAHHYLGVDTQLRAVLAWFGALLAPTSVYLTSRDFESGELTAATAVEDVRALARTLVTLAERVGGTMLGPAPLAARSG